MKLPDFLSFEAFNRIRHRMGAEQLGKFEFFDPTLHLTAAERLELEAGIAAGWERVRSLHDFTLAYKNSRVLLWLPASEEPQTSSYHLAWCRALRNLRRRSPEKRFQLSTCLPEPEPWPRQVCESCLQQLRFQGYDGARSRHRDYSERIRKNFDLDEFFAQYPAYPLPSDVLRALDATTSVQWVESLSSPASEK